MFNVLCDLNLFMKIFMIITLTLCRTLIELYSSGFIIFSHTICYTPHKQYFMFSIDQFTALGAPIVDDRE